MADRHAARELVSALRECLISRIADEKAYDVPGFCIVLGLAEGDGEEAFKSKAKYASRRLVGLSKEALITAAERALEHSANFTLEETLNKLKEATNPRITPVTRRRLLDIFAKVPLSSQVEEIDFIRSFWPTEAMRPTRDYGIRYDPWEQTLTVDGVLWHYMVENLEWSAKEALDAVGFLDASEALTFKVLEASVGPIHRRLDEVDDVVARMNDVLSHDNLRLAQIGKMSGSPTFKVLPKPAGSPADEIIAEALRAFDPETVHERWQAALNRRSTEPEGAITLARTLLEDVCRWILDEAGDETVSPKDDLPRLYSKLAKVLNLAPDAHTEQVFKQILGSCQQIVEQLGALRNKISDAHSRGPKKVKPKARHAELAVN